MAKQCQPDSNRFRRPQRKEVFLKSRISDDLAEGLLPHKGRLFVLSGPSGVGKDSVLHALLQEPRRPDKLVRCVTATTRERRTNECEGVDYFFLQETEFKERIRGGFFLEHADYNGKRYGTPADFVEQQQTKGNNVILKIEVHGALQVKARAADAILIFLAPPSWDTLEHRLRERATEKHEDVKSRLEIARQEMDTAAKYDYLVVNDTVEEAVEALRAIILAEQHRIARGGM
jgi:guanylate kinase